jgi:hypothetical protein
MVGVDYFHLHDVDIFNLLGLDPYIPLGQSYESILKTIRTAYLRAMLVAHPDKTKGGPETAKELNMLKDFLFDFDHSHIAAWSRVNQLVERGLSGWVSNWNPWLHPNLPGFHEPIPAYSRRFILPKTLTSVRRRLTVSETGSSPSNPIVLDCWTRSGAPSPEPSPRASKKPNRDVAPSHSTASRIVNQLTERELSGWMSTWHPWLHDPGFHEPILTYSRRLPKPKTPTSVRRRLTVSKAGSSPSNPIVLDC